MPVFHFFPPMNRMSPSRASVNIVSCMPKYFPVCRGMKICSALISRHTAVSVFEKRITPPDSMVPRSSNILMYCASLFFVSGISIPRFCLGIRLTVRRGLPDLSLVKSSVPLRSTVRLPRETGDSFAGCLCLPIESCLLFFFTSSIS